MKKTSITGLLVLTAAITGVAGASTAPTAPRLRVVAAATALSTVEKGGINGEHCGCEPHDLKPGYGFGTTGHYGPPGQGFDSHDSWRMHVRGDGLTPNGLPLPPRAFTTPTR